jgi:acetylxylan esterase
MKLSTSPSAAAAMALAASTLAAAQNSTACSTGVHMLVARGSDEAPGPGRMGIIADGILEAIPGSNIESVAYPATFTEYAESVNDGIEAMGFALTRYAERCPDSKVVLMGYSQGGQVTINTLCGGPGEDEVSVLPFDSNPPISSALVNSSGMSKRTYSMFRS